MVWKTQVSTTRTHTAGGPSTSNENSRVEWFDVPPKVTGSWLNFPDGSRFRRATNYSRVHLRLTPNSPASMVAYRASAGRNWTRIGSAGLHPMNNFSSGNWIYRFGDAGISQLNGAPTIPTMERNEAITKCLNDIADQKANIGENLATLGQTIRMFKNPVSAYINLLKAGYRGDFAKYAKKSYRQLRREGVSKSIAGKYLEYVYGFAPLMQDIHGVAELAKNAGKKPLFVHGNSSAAGREWASGQLTYLNASSDQDEYMDVKSYSKTRAKLWAKLSDQWPVSRVLNQLGLTNPASLVWELVPLSFVVDWILPIGPVLSALTAPCGLDFVNGSISRRVTMSGTFSIQYGQWFQTKYVSSSEGRGTVSYEGYIRQEITSWPQPGLWIDVDPLRLKSDGSDRDFKALALAITRLPR